MDDLISRQAAIEAIQNLYPGMPRFNVCSNILDRWYKTNKQYIECEDAINKLPSVQPEKVCIANITMSEEQVLEAVEKAKSEIIQLLPSKQSERKKGKWFNYQGNTKIVLCSECRMPALESMTGCLSNQHLAPNRTNFCPNCGADMREEKADAEDIH